MGIEWSGDWRTDRRTQDRRTHKRRGHDRCKPPWLLLVVVSHATLLGYWVATNPWQALLLPAAAQIFITWKHAQIERNRP